MATEMNDIPAARGVAQLPNAPVTSPAMRNIAANEHRDIGPGKTHHFDTDCCPCPCRGFKLANVPRRLPAGTDSPANSQPS